MRRAALFLALAASSVPALAQEESPERQAELTVFGADPCPQSSDEEIVVCHRRPEEERYRIPAPLRRSSRNAEQSWGARVETLDEVSRSSRPNSCSPVGSFGQTGCREQMVREWYESRRGR